jgi:hypothetical protein
MSDDERTQSPSDGITNATPRSDEAAVWEPHGLRAVLAGRPTATGALRFVGLVAFVIGGWAVAGTAGILVGVVTGIVGVAWTPIYTVAVAHLLVVPLLVGDAPWLGGPSFGTLATIELGLLAVLASDPRYELGDGVAVVAAGAALAGLVWAGTGQWGVLPTAALLILVGVGGAYAIHRYEHVAVGLGGSLDEQPAEVSESE